MNRLFGALLALCLVSSALANCDDGYYELAIRGENQCVQCDYGAATCDDGTGALSEYDDLIQGVDGMTPYCNVYYYIE